MSQWIALLPVVRKRQEIGRGKHASYLTLVLLLPIFRSSIGKGGQESLDGGLQAE